MHPVNKLCIIGIGYKPLDKKAREIIYASEIILASGRLFEVFKGYEEFEKVQDKIKVINNVAETINFISAQIKNTSPNPTLGKGGYGGIVLLASGDPMFFGISRRAVKEFGKETVEILPDLSSIQAAFSKIKEPWDDAFLMSLHGGPDPEKRRRLPYEIKDIPALLQQHNKIAILTDKENNPSEIASILLNSQLSTPNSQLIVYVCERLGYSDEKITEGTPVEIAGMLFASPNVVIVKIQDTGYKIQDEKSRASCIMHHASHPASYCFGLTEDEIAHSRGIITKDEVRAATIHKSRLPQRGVFWDIGAGSGSIAIEAARLCPELKIFAVEKNEEQVCNIKENKARFNAANVEIIKGAAPEVLTSLPAPDRAFVGGSGGRLKDIIDFIAKMRTSIIVINAVTIETLNEAVQNLENNKFEVEISEISVSRSKSIAGKRHMNALNPIFVITGERQR